MKKRIFMLAMLAALVLSSTAMAWAEELDYYFKLNSATYLGKEVVSTEGDTPTIKASFQVKVGYKVVTSGTTTGVEGYSKNANLVKWTISENDEGSFTPTAVTIYRGSNAEVEDDTGEVNRYLIEVSDELENGSVGTLTLTIETTGTMSDTAHTLSITVGLYSTVDAASPITIATISSAADTPSATETVDTTEPENADTLDKRDPDSVFWNGLDPTFSNTINKTSYDIGKNKPKLGKIDKTKLTFTPNTASDLEIPMLGPIELVDVYIAQKDAKKLYPASADSISGNIRLTSASIKAYKIPFRVTATNFATTVTATGDDEAKLKKAQAKAWKSAESSLTLSFNGSKMQYKGFPITIAMSNSNTGSKPVAKAIKLNIGDNFTTPAWTYVATSTDKTTDAEKYEAWTVGEDGTYYKDIVYTNEYEATSANPLDTDEVAAAGLDATELSDGQHVVGTIDNNDYIYTDGKFYPAALKVDYYYRNFTYNKMIDKKDKLEASTWVNDSAAGTADDPKAGEIEKIYYASADAPYAITAKPDPAKDTAKITKFFASGYSVDIHQPVYDYLGNVKTHGYVRLAGSPTETSKESKLAFTFTATNPSTKKKGAAKVTANAKTFPEIDKTSNVTITAAQQADWDGAYDYDYYATREGSYGEDGSITYKRATVKRVEAGKVPSVKVKAKGSKNISYLLGKYTVEDGELYSYNDDFNAAMLANLKALKLSFDEKKGAVVLLDKSDKATKPTLNSDGDAFQSLDIVITAVNNVGYDQAWAHVAITGAKPKVADKSVEVSGTMKKGQTIKFKVLAGKEAAEGLTDGSANVKVYAADSAAATTLSGYGLALVPYDSMDVMVSKEITYTTGTVLPTSFVKKDDDSNIKTGSVSALVEGDEGYDPSVTKYKAGEYGVTILSGDTWAKGTDSSNKNYGILQVIDPSALAAKSKDKTANKGVSVNLTLENLGSTNKGKLKVIIKDTVDGGDPTVPVVTTSDSSSESSESPTETTGAAPKTNGTAGLTYNGALPDEAETEEAAEDVTVTVGEPRTVADLTAGQQAYLAAKSLKVIAVLPEISATADGQQEFAVELDEDAPEGAKMVYVPFPQDVEETDDDKIADFYGADGEAIEEVPAEKDITVAPWLRADVVYQPVIAVEAE